MSRKRAWGPLWGAVAVLATIVILGVLASPAEAQPPEPHQYIQEYEGPSTCEACHGSVTEEVVHSVHYSWSEKMDHYSPIAGTIARINWLGMLNADLGIPGGCARCHIGDGSMPKSPEEITPEDRAGIDCLICHSPVYETSLRFPVQDEDGDWTLTQDRNTLTARQAQRPTAENCLLCHFNVGGGPLAKRGVDFAPISDKHGEASKGDVHADAGMACIDCHAGQDHQVMGYGPNLWSRDLPDQRLTCDQCHTSTPHHDPIINNNHARIDCRTCHVPGTGGLVFRDWTAELAYDPVTELYAPADVVREPNSVKPKYLWFNGGIAKPDEPWPGDRWDAEARIQPFKEFDAVVPADAESSAPIPLKLQPLYAEGDLEQAIAQGAADSGMDYSGSWEPLETEAFLQISHGVVGKSEALYCQDCHVLDGRLDFEALGYTADEVVLLSSISSAEAGVRQPLKMQVVIPEPQPLPTPVTISGDVEAAKGLGIDIPFTPVLIGLLIVVVVAGAIVWLWRQRPFGGSTPPGPEDYPPGSLA